MSNLVNVVKALLGSKFDVRSFKAKNRVFEFDYQRMNMFEYVLTFEKRMFEYVR